MGIDYNPKIVMPNLAICLDSANPKSILSQVECLIVGGGGGGGFGHGGGGAGGAVLYNPSLLLTTPGTAYSIVVGAGGAGNANNAANNPGASSSAFGATATGGGSGANETGEDTSGRAGAGGTGANGGGGDYNFRPGGVGTAPSAPTGWIVYAGYAGGAGGSSVNANYPTGGGAGAGGVGVNATTGTTGGAAGPPGQTAGNGGPGVLSSILGVDYYWAGGGGGVTYNTLGIPGNGGIGGGGGGSSQLGSVFGTGGGSALNPGSNGTIGNDATGGAAGANTGGGGGGGANENGIGGAGGSGIVVIRYPGAQLATGGTITSTGGYTIHVFTSSGTFNIPSWVDVSGNSKNGSLVAGITYDTTNQGSLFFNAANEIVTANSVFSGAVNTTWEAVVKSAGSVSAYDMFMGSYPPYYCFRSGTHFFFSTITGGVQRNLQTPTNKTINTWYHTVTTLSYDGTNTTINMYTNGVLDATGSFAGIPTYLGAVTLGDGRSTSWYRFQGNIALARVYTTALSQEQITQNFDAIRGRYGI